MLVSRFEPQGGVEVEGEMPEMTHSFSQRWHLCRAFLFAAALTGLLVPQAGRPAVTSFGLVTLAQAEDASDEELPPPGEVSGDTLAQPDSGRDSTKPPQKSATPDAAPNVANWDEEPGKPAAVGQAELEPEPSAAAPANEPTAPEPIAPGSEAVAPPSAAAKPIAPLPPVAKERVTGPKAEPKGRKPQAKKTAEHKPSAPKRVPATAPKAMAPKVKPPTPKLPSPAVNAAPQQAPAPAKARQLGTTRPLAAFDLGRYQYCGDDRDCVVVTNGCCDCANGGSDVAINKEHLDEFSKRFDCMHVQCGQKAAQPRCGEGLVSCVNHTCRYFEEAVSDEKDSH